MIIQDAQTLASGTEKISFKKNFTPEEIQGKKDNVVQTLTNLDKLENELSVLKAQYKSKIETAEGFNKMNVRHINDGFQHMTKECFMVRNEEEQTILYVDPDDGEVVSERPMRSDEKQFRLNLESRK